MIRDLGASSPVRKQGTQVKSDTKQFKKNTERLQKTLFFTFTYNASLLKTLTSTIHGLNECWRINKVQIKAGELKFCSSYIVGQLDQDMLDWVSNLQSVIKPTYIMEIDRDG